MSCHTWGYKRVKDLTQEEYKSLKEVNDEYAKSVLNKDIVKFYNAQQHAYDKIGLSLDDVKKYMKKM